MLAVLVSIAALFTTWATWRRWRLRQRLSQSGQGGNWHLWLVQGLLLLALGCILMGARKTTIETPCVAFLLDCSESMRAEGVGAQNRLEEGRAAIRQLANACRGYDVVLVTYAGSAFVDCPPTSDRSAFNAALEAAGPGALYLSGSAPEQALRQAEALGVAAIVLVSDGEMNPPDGTSVAIWRTRKTPLVAICCGAIGIPRQIPRKNGVLYDETTGLPALTTTTVGNVVQVSTLSGAPFGGVSEATGSPQEAAAFLQKYVGGGTSPRRYLLYAIVLLFLALCVEPLVRYMRDSNWVKKLPRELIKADVSCDVSNAAERRDPPREGARHRIALGEHPQGANPGNVEKLRYLRPGRAPHFSCYIVAPFQGAWTILHSIPWVRALWALTQGYPMSRHFVAIAPLQGALTPSLMLALLFALGGFLFAEPPAATDARLEELRVQVRKAGQPAARARLNSNLAALLCIRAQNEPEKAGEYAYEAVHAAREALKLAPGLAAAATNLELAQRLLLQDGATATSPQAPTEKQPGEGGEHDAQASGAGEGESQQEANTDRSFGTWRDLQEAAARRQLRAAPQGVKPW